MARQHGYIGRCPVKGCGHTARQLGAFSRPARCPEHEQRITLEPVWGETVETVRCDARCQNAPWRLVRLLVRRKRTTAAATLKRLQRRRSRPLSMSRTVRRPWSTTP